MKFLQLAQQFQNIEETASRNEITQIIVELLGEASEKEAQIIVYMLMGRVAPLFVPAEFNMSEKTLLKVFKEYAAANSLKLDVEKVRNQAGDIGAVAEQLSSIADIKGSGEGLEEIYEVLWRVVNTIGTGSVAMKSSIVSEQLAKLSPIEQKFFARIVVGTLRLGASDKTVLDALSISKHGDKSYRKKLDQYYGVSPDLGYIAHLVLTDSDDSEVVPTPGVPVFSRLVERVADFGEVFERLGEIFYLQPKFDGLRCQAHKGVDYERFSFDERVWYQYFAQQDEGENIGMFESASEQEVRSEIKLFSRNLEEMTEMFPDVVEALAGLECDSCILDAEIVGWDEAAGSYIPFQETMQRKRKYDIETLKDQIPVRLYVFDLLELNGKSMMEVDFEERFEKLKKLVSDPDDKILMLTETREVVDQDQLDEFFQQSVSQGLEGLIAKLPTGGYQPGTRNYEWIKLKKSMDRRLVDSVDLVIMGYYYGSGKQANFGMGALLGGVYNKETEKIESVTKIGTGVTEEQWGVIGERLNLIKSEEMPKEYLVAKELEPDVWVFPEVVCSIEADEITKSKVHKAGSEKLGNGLALRFPRLIEFDRDKRVEDATSVEELVKLAGLG